MVNEQTPLIPQPVGSISDRRQQRKREATGLLCMALSALGFSLMSLFVKLSGSSFPSFEIVFARSIIQTILGLIGCFILRVHPLGDPKVRPWLAFRGLVGSLGLALFFYSITKLPLADATVIFFLGPTFTAILAAIVLGESFTLFDGICSALCLVGVILVSKPEFLFGSNNGDFINEDASWTRILAILCSLLGAVMSAFAYVTVRRIGKGASYMVHVVYFGGISTVVSALGMWLWQGYISPSGWKEYTMLLLVGISAFIGQCLLNQGLQMAPAGPGTLMRMNDVVFAFLFGILILHEYPDIYSVSGACLIVLMTTALGLHKWWSSTRH
ncbi:EamA-like transporter family-domain-containing protein [Halteromyces radiatus]|uniref:EamA-like transporter family-domain-containing protein n=1 Tax=Halteromyces radiatus TaxID=101107 RepID=UPI00221F91CA|nr:EamA-like transporter family-domain-containing protein [Halteromyces radiatus]KAI8089574.1 EamA-like transporter family-domain-containing protein [Halteromyces radiatus]